VTEKTIVLPPNSSGNGSDANYRLTLMAPRRRYLSYLRNRWWVVVICLALSVGGLVAYETVRPETYTSYAQLYLTLGPQLGTSIFAEPKDDFATQIELLKGSRLHREAMQSLGPETLNQLKGNVNVDVFRPMGTSILQLQATSSDPDVSQKFLQALIAQFLDFKKQTRLSTTEDVVANLNDELSLREAALKEDQDKWSGFQKTNDVPLAEEEAKRATFDLADLNSQIEKLTLEREDALSASVPTSTNVEELAVAANLAGGATNKLASVPETNLMAVATNLAGGATNLSANATNSSPESSLDSDAELKKARIQLEVTREQREQTLKDRGPAAAQKFDDEVSQLELTVAALDRAASAERQERLRQIDESIADRRAAIPGVVEKLQSANELLTQAQAIKDDMQRQQANYDNILGMLRGVDLNKNMEQERVTPLEPPSPGIPAQRNLPLRVFLAAAGGLFLALGIVFVWHLMDDRLVSIHDLKDQFGETLLGLVPWVRVPKAKPQAALLQPGDKRSGYVESYRHLRSAILLSSLGEKRPQTLLFTGAIPAEGKTTIAVNLARMLAQSGLRVTLVDADLRGGHIHQMIGQQVGPGFLDFLRGQADAAAIIYPTELPGLSFVPSGTAGEETDKLLAHPNVAELMKELKAGRDFVILDGAPILATDDASLLVPYADAVVMVMRPFYTRARQARRALEMLYQRRARQVALILNRAHADDLAGEYYAYKRKSRPAKNGRP
jgi:capsular exopolysaccharide synthesis family protein